MVNRTLLLPVSGLRRSQFLVSLKQTIGQRHKFQIRSKVLLKEKVADSGQMAQKPQSLFKGQFIGFKGK
jgi:hypothetical protein